jgi:cbb3-type cytochrome oxidase maturation protein
MSVLFLLIGASILVAAGFLAAFIWSVKNGQYDDDYTPSVRILFENETPELKNKKTQNN